MNKGSIIIAAMLLSACGSGLKTEDKSIKPSNMSNDIHSFSRPYEAIMTHLSLDLKVDFESKTLTGSADLLIENKTGTDSLLLDVRDLNISEVLIDGELTTFKKGPEKPYLGQSLSITIKPNTKKVTIRYTTSPNAAALQWLEPGQTAGGKHPFLFTQSQAVLARTWIPLQDSPGVKFTYDARITVPAGMMALMSAENDTIARQDGIFSFRMPQPISSYLMALAVGNLEFRSYDGRCGVFAEPALIEKATYEFADLPKMISSAEELYGPYTWGRYDVLVLPPSFPFGGMENPRITFATPTIIAGDRSLVALIAHELAHSWSGNLVTNATWNDFWLNEGFTVYFETRIMEKIYGKDYADMLTLLSLDELKNTIHEMGETSRETHLYADLEGKDPDDGVSDIAYEKGRFFLTAIEESVGRQKWDAFLNAYFKEFAFKSMDTKTFLEYLDEKLIQGNEDLKKRIQVDAWVYGPGLPSNCPVIKSVELEKAGAAAKSVIDDQPLQSLVTDKWTTHHWLYFLRELRGKIDVAKVEALDSEFGFTNSGNSEIQCEWYQLSIATGYQKAFPNMEKFLISVGRRKFIKPIYSALAKSPENLALAKRIYAKARPGYHAVAAQTMDEMLK
jgi:leukotriene A-4 hydrolase/aminopeptidase